LGKFLQLDKKKVGESNKELLGIIFLKSPYLEKKKLEVAKFG